MQLFGELQESHQRGMVEGGRLRFTVPLGDRYPWTKKMTEKSTLFCLGVSFLLSVSCEDHPVAFQAGSIVAFAADQENYTLDRTTDGYRVEIPFTYHNRSGRTIYVVNCNGAAPPVLEKNKGETWTVAWSGGAPDCLSPAIEIRNGSTYHDTLHVFAADPTTGIRPRFEDGEPQGTYRLLSNSLLWSFDASTYPFGEDIPVELRQSEPFLLQTSDQPTR